MSATRIAETTWHGSLQEGAGTVTLQSSGVGSFEVTWPSRAEQPDGRTSPEELIAAAHTSCFCMALSGGLAKAGTPPEEIVASAQVTFVPGTGITTSRLTVRARVPGISDEAFQEAANSAKENCPVSKALTGVKITLDAALADD
jgi:osmotically inducible protein OsmC